MTANKQLIATIGNKDGSEVTAAQLLAWDTKIAELKPMVIRFGQIVLAKYVAVREGDKIYMVDQNVA